MKKDSNDQNIDDEELRPEYELSQLKGGVRGKYADRFNRRTNLALLASDVRQAFPTDDAVNQALRTMMANQTN